MLSCQDRKKFFTWNNCQISPYGLNFHVKQKADWCQKPFLSNHISKIGLVLWEYIFWRDGSPVIPCSMLVSLEDIFANNRLSRDSVTSHCFTYNRPGELDDIFLILIFHSYRVCFYLVWTRGHPQYRIGSTHLAPKSRLVSGKEVVFFEM